METLRAVGTLRRGDRVDLQGDKFADPKGENVFLQCEYAVVNFVQLETENCLLVGFEGFDQIGFPLAHKVKVLNCLTIKTAVPQNPSMTQMDLARSLACYTSDDDWGEDRSSFLKTVCERIELDLLTGDY